jgi:hypothetical protein
MITLEPKVKSITRLHLFANSLKAAAVKSLLFLLVSFFQWIPADAQSHVPVEAEGRNGSNSVREPSPWIDIQRFNGRPSPCGHVGGVANSGTITSDSLNVVTTNGIECAGNDGFLNGDWLYIPGAGPKNNLSTPPAPAVTPSIDMCDTLRCGYGVPAPKGSSATGCYKLIAIDLNDGMSLPSPETCVTTGQPLGEVTTTASATRNSASQITYTVRLHTLSNDARIYVSGCSDRTYDGWFNVQEHTRTTITTHQTGSYLSYLSPGGYIGTTSARGCSLRWDNENQIALPWAIGIRQFLICKGITSGSEIPYALSTLNIDSGELAANFWEDYGPTNSQQPMPAYIPSAACSTASPLRDALYTQVKRGQGTTTLTISPAASSPVTDQLVLQDNTQAALAAQAYANAHGGIVYIPPTSFGTWYFNSYGSFSNAFVYTNSSMAVNHTLNFNSTGILGGVLPNRRAPYSLGTFAPNPGINIICGATPCIYAEGATFSDLNINAAPNSAGILMYNRNEGPNMYRVNFWNSGSCGEAWVEFENFPAGGFGYHFYDMALNGVEGSPCAVAKIYNNSLMHFSDITGSRNGMFFGGTQEHGFSVKIDVNHDWQLGGASLGCLFEFFRYHSNDTSTIEMGMVTLDSTYFPQVPTACFSGSAQYNGALEISGYSAATVTGQPVPSILIKNIAGGTTYFCCQNRNVHIMNMGTNGEVINQFISQGGPASMVGIGEGTLAAPTAPLVRATTTCPSPNGHPSGTGNYQVVWVDSTGGVTSLGAPSSNVTLNGSTQCASITEPSPVPEGAQCWLVYAQGDFAATGLVDDRVNPSCPEGGTPLKYTTIIDETSFKAGGAPAVVTAAVHKLTNRGFTGAINTLTEGTVYQCFSSASPALCGRDIDGFVTIAAGSSSVVVNTTRLTAKSEISLTFDSSQGGNLGVTCNTSPQQPYISARVPGVSFTVSVPSNFTGNPGCIGFHFKN